MNIKNILIITILLIATIVLMVLNLKPNQPVPEELIKPSNQAPLTNIENQKTDEFSLFGLNIQRVNGYNYYLEDYKVSENNNYRTLQISVSNSQVLMTILLSDGNMPNIESNLINVKEFGVIDSKQVRYGLDMQASSKNYTYRLFNEDKLMITLKNELKSNIYFNTKEKSELAQNQLKELTESLVKVIDGINLEKDFKQFNPESKIERKSDNIYSDNLNNNKFMIKIENNTEPKFNQLYNLTPVFAPCNGKISFNNIDKPMFNIDCDNGKTKFIRGFDYPLYRNKLVKQGDPISIVKSGSTITINQELSTH